ncbi:MAG: RnfABCDGE type electron transport complex subunit B [Candidatus Omnitrophica bacterium]|nr:RnfABCDGE type electron transport complex subunit B [Candidatus Omnitrophota bacterium]MBU2044441.1 RnfABCDGE type electron transport complex subunit B [Candidatus Omnitrophota bacterium]MBU2250713.1 RnfABCDGE type electron transport complex subunit B [Candidatus Omnitrophota bacterium]MBU2265484.1 RnfABCDGE type electron transport complex subunit B [Candidatus Omnitrophota bacterium]MBU2473719.1 RnfABCDGE type electron transport complex subunit B [Candidatus Omnitrophota bacterium]
MITTAIITLGVAGFIFSLTLALLSKRLKVEEDPRALKVIEILPGLNCGACGFSGCRAFAEAVVREGQIFNGCLPGGDELNQQISAVIGVTACLQSKSQVVVCRCGAEASEKKVATDYQGLLTCRAAQITGGALDCLYGCLAFGDCLKVCPVSALSLENKKIRVDFSKCIACGKCIQACPRNLFELVPWSKVNDLYWVACNNTEKALKVKKVCSRGCISCTICAKVSESPYYIKNNLSYLDYTKLSSETPLEAAKTKCPTKCIFSAKNPKGA